MDFWLWWLVLGVVLLIVEAFVGTLDALAIGIASLLTGILSYIFGLGTADRKISAGIFLIASLLTIAITRLMVLPKIQNTSSEPMSGATIKGKIFTVEIINTKQVVRYEGVYRNILADEEVNAGDQVVVDAMQDNKLLVHKRQK